MKLYRLLSLARPTGVHGLFSLSIDARPPTGLVAPARAAACGHPEVHERLLASLRARLARGGWRTPA